MTEAVAEERVETATERNRRLFPGMTQFVDDLRRVFGSGVKVREIHNDTGAKAGMTGEESGEVKGFWTADEWLHMGAKVESTKDVMARAKEDQKRMENLRKGRGGKK